MVAQATMFPAEAPLLTTSRIQPSDFVADPQEIAPSDTSAWQVFPQLLNIQSAHSVYIRLNRYTQKLLHIVADQDHPVTSSSEITEQQTDDMDLPSSDDLCHNIHYQKYTYDAPVYWCVNAGIALYRWTAWFAPCLACFHCCGHRNLHW